MPLNIPILLTWARIVLIPLFVGVLYLPEHWLAIPQQNLVATVIFIAAAVTDWFDGWLARRLERFLEEGMADGTIAACEPRLVVQLLVGMLIWLTKWTPTTPGLTNERLLEAIETTALQGLATT